MKKIYINRNDLFRDFQMILLNNITTVDEDFLEDNIHLYSDECEECTGETDGACKECDGYGLTDMEPYQLFIVDPDEWQITNLASYGVELGYSELLQKHILPIYDYGTAWRMFSYEKEVDDDYILGTHETLENKTPY